MFTAETKSIFFTSEKRSLFIGQVEATLKKSNAASTLLLALERDIEVQDTCTGKIVLTKSLLIPAGSNITVNTHGANVAQCFLDDLGTDLARLIPQMRNAVYSQKNEKLYCNIKNEDSIIQHARNLLVDRPSNAVAIKQLDDWVNAFPDTLNYSYDLRIEQAIAMIKANYSENLSVEEVAASVGLSVPRFSQLFKQVTGVPVRRFRLWHRIFATASKMTEGCSLTEAAVETGFSDYSQMCRVFKELTGSKPSAVKNTIEARLIAA